MNNIFISFDITAGCDHPGKVANGFVIPDQTRYDLGQEVEFACRDPYMVDGQAKTHCIIGNRWTYPTPKCTEEGKS